MRNYPHYTLLLNRFAPITSILLHRFNPLAPYSYIVLPQITPYSYIILPPITPPLILHRFPDFPPLHTIGPLLLNRFPLFSFFLPSFTPLATYFWIGLAHINLPNSYMVLPPKLRPLNPSPLHRITHNYPPKWFLIFNGNGIEISPITPLIIHLFLFRQPTSSELTTRIWKYDASSVAFVKRILSYYQRSASGRLLMPSARDFLFISFFK